MAVIKEMDRFFGHVWNGDWSPEFTVEEAVRIIKRSREDEGVMSGICYIGERGVVDVDVSRVKCEQYRDNSDNYPLKPSTSFDII